MRRAFHVVDKYGPTVAIMVEDEMGVERKLTLPAKNEVCGRCEGEGRILHPDIGEHAYSAEEFNDSFDEEEAKEYFKGGHGMYGVVCPECKGNKVVKVLDRDTFTKPAHLKLLKRLDSIEAARQQCDEEAQSERRMLALMGGEC